MDFERTLERLFAGSDPSAAHAAHRAALLDRLLNENRRQQAPLAEEDLELAAGGLVGAKETQQKELRKWMV